MKNPIAALVVLAAGCASGPARDHAAPPLFRVAVEGTPATPFQAHRESKPAAAPPVLPPAPGARRGVSLEIRFTGSDGTAVLAPRITAFHGQRANVQVLRQVAYVADFDVEKKDGAAVANPVVAMEHDGILLETVARIEGAAVVLSWAVRIRRSRAPMDCESFTDLQGNRCTIQLPTVDRSEAEGVRALAPGTWGLLARLPDGNGGSLAVTARAEAVDLEFDSAAEDARDIAFVDGGARPGKAESPLPAVAARPGAPAGALEVRAVTLRTDLPAGSVVELSALGDAALEPLAPGDLAVVTQVVPGTRVACLLDEAFVREYAYDGASPPETVDPVVAVHTSGLEASVGEDGVLDLSWTTTPRWDRFTVAPAGTHDLRRFSIEEPWSATRRARVAAGPGARVVVLSPLGDGRVAAVLVRFRPE